MEFKDRPETVTVEAWKEYLEVQHGGLTNMFDLKTVEILSGLDPIDIKEIMQNYEKYQELYK